MRERNKKIIGAVLAAAVFAASVIYAGTNGKTVATDADVTDTRRIIIDAGHGGLTNTID